MNKIKSFIIPIENLTIKRMRDCLEISNPNNSFGDEYVQAMIENSIKNHNNTKAVVFYCGIRPRSCDGFLNVDWEIESKKQEWQVNDDY